MSGPLSSEELKEVESAMEMARNNEDPPAAATATKNDEPMQSPANKPAPKSPPKSKTSSKDDEAAATTPATGAKKSKSTPKRKDPPKYAEGSPPPKKRKQAAASSEKKKKKPAGEKKKRKPAVREKDEKAWNTRFEELKAWKQEHGHTKVSRTCKENPALGRWCQHQRELYRNRLSGKTNVQLLDPDKMARLVSIGFEFVIRSDAWETQYNELVKYKKDHGDFNVPHKTKLGRWVSDQRRTYRNRLNGVKKGTYITPERIVRLESIGFTWDTTNLSSLWDSQFRELQAFKQEHGHCNVPKPRDGATSLGIWVSHQRVEGRKMRKGEPSCLSKDRADRLDSLGFQWELKKSPNTAAASKKEEPMQELKIAAKDDAVEGGTPQKQTVAV